MAAHSRADPGIGMLLSDNAGTPPEVINLGTGRNLRILKVRQKF